MARKKIGRKSRFALLLVCVIVILFVFVGTIFKDWLQIVQNKHSLALMNVHYEELLEEETSLTSEVTKLHDRDYIARYARERYMYSLPGEIIIKMPNEEK